jgi:hypothetical protein
MVRSMKARGGAIHVASQLTLFEISGSGLHGPDGLSRLPTAGHMTLCIIMHCETFIVHGLMENRFLLA